jgi:hypothetical protein
MGKIQTPVSNEHLRAIGQITVNFANLEGAISFFVWELISNDQRFGQIITAELSFRNLVGLLSSIYKYRANNQGQIIKLEELLNRALHVEEQRNLIIHSQWAAGSKPETITRLKTTAKKSKGLTHQFEQLKIEDLDKIADIISDVDVEIQLFMFETMASK